MRLLIAADIFPPESGGPATYVVNLANTLAKQGNDVVIVSLNSKSDKNILDQKVRLYPVASGFKPLRYWQYYNLLKKYGKDTDVIYAMGPVNAGWPALKVAKKLGKKFVVKVVGDYAWEQGQVSGKVKDSIDDFQYKNCGGKIGWLQKIERRVVRTADMVIVPSKYLGKIVEGWGCDKGQIKVIYNEVDFVIAEPIKHEGEKWLVSVGRLVPWKGMDTLIEVISDLVNRFPKSTWKLKIVGDGPELDKLKKKVANRDLSDVVQLTGNLPKEKTLAYIASADVFVLNSAYEGFSHTLIEAHNQGVPVLASRVGGNPEVVGDPNLFEYNNQQEILEKVLQQSNFGKQSAKRHSFGNDIILETKEILEQLCTN